MDEASSAALIEMIDHAYAATTDPARWSDFLTTVSGHFRDASTILWHADLNDGRCNIFASHRYEASALQALQDHCFSINRRAPMPIAGGARHRTEALYPAAELRTEFHSDWLAPNDLFESFGISLFNDRRFGCLSIVRPKHAGPPSSGELRLLELLTPHLQRAIQLHERLRIPPQLAAPALSALDCLSRGVAFLRRDRRAHYTNPAASRMFASADGLLLDCAGCLRASRPVEQAVLDRLIDGAIGGRWRADPGGGGALPASGGGMLVARQKSGGRPYCVVVAPAPVPPFGFAADHVAAIVLISDPDGDAAARRDLLRRLYQLSAKEAELAVKISNGENLGSAARATGITYETARTYLKTVFAKLGVGRQAELASVVQKLAADG